MPNYRERTDEEKVMIAKLTPIIAMCQKHLKKWQWDLSHLKDVIQLRPVYDIVLRVSHQIQHATDTETGMAIAHLILTIPTDLLFDELVKQGHIVGTKFMGVDYPIWARRNTLDLDTMPDGVKAVFETMLKLKGVR